MKIVQINPRILRLVGTLAGMVMGAVLVMLDPVLRFPEVPARINLQDTLLTAVVIGAYGLLLAWVVTQFWHTRLLWLVTLVAAPFVTLVIIIWNLLTAAIGGGFDLILFFPVILVLHIAMTILTVICFEMARRLPGRQRWVFVAVPLVLFVFTFLVLARLRWENQDAIEVMNAVNQYADVTFGGDYEIEYRGITYRSGRVPVASTRIYTDDDIYECQSDIYTDALATRIETDCEIQE